MKKCSRCTEILPREEFYKHKRQKDGLQSCCKSCTIAYRQSNKEAITEREKLHYQNNKERLLRYQSAYQLEHGYKNKCRNAAQGCHHAAIRKGARKCDCCTYEDLIKFYMDRSEGMTVDHIVPCSKGGMHCLKNMQYLTMEENQKKGVNISGQTPITSVR